jgi:hypothetical protein
VLQRRRQILLREALPGARRPPVGKVDSGVARPTPVALGVIANRYNVTLASLRTANHLNGDLIRVGKELVIPTG